MIWSKFWHPPRRPLETSWITYRHAGPRGPIFVTKKSGVRVSHCSLSAVLGCQTVFCLNLKRYFSRFQSTGCCLKLAKSLKLKESFSKSSRMLLIPWHLSFSKLNQWYLEVFSQSCGGVANLSQTKRTDFEGVRRRWLCQEKGGEHEEMGPWYIWHSSRQIPICDMFDFSRGGNQKLPSPIFMFLGGCIYISAFIYVQEVNQKKKSFIECVILGHLPTWDKGVLFYESTWLGGGLIQPTWKICGSQIGLYFPNGLVWFKKIKK